MIVTGSFQLSGKLSALSRIEADPSPEPSVTTSELSMTA